MNSTHASQSRRAHAARAFRLFVALAAISCIRPSEDHEALDSVVGSAENAAIRLQVLGDDGAGQAAVLRLEPDEGELWAASPVLSLRVSGFEGEFTLTVNNVLPNAELRSSTQTLARETAERVTVGRWRIPMSLAGEALTLGSADAEDPRPHTLAVLSDIQNAVGTVGDIFASMNERAPLYVISTGDLTDNGSADELRRIQEELALLEMPFYSTAGNHEVPGANNWHAMFGPFSSFFIQHGVAVSLVDSSNATIDPDLYERTLAFAERQRGAPHLWLTHVPLLDAAGVRSGAFRSRNEAARTLQMLAERDVDALFFGHVHSYYAYELAGVPAYISGGGGALPERLDGIDRHYLLVDLVPSDPDPIAGVTLVRVD